jgi:hypothetical protein
MNIRNYSLKELFVEGGPNTADELRRQFQLSAGNPACVHQATTLGGPNVMELALRSTAVAGGGGQVEELR